MTSEERQNLIYRVGVHVCTFTEGYSSEDAGCYCAKQNKPRLCEQTEKEATEILLMIEKMQNN